MGGATGVGWGTTLGSTFQPIPDPRHRLHLCGFLLPAQLFLSHLVACEARPPTEWANRALETSARMLSLFVQVEHMHCLRVACAAFGARARLEPLPIAS